MSAFSLIERRLVKWNQLAYLLPKPNEVLPSLDSVNKLLKVCADSRYLRVGESIHAQLILRNQVSQAEDLFQINSLINLYVKCKETVCARKLFDTMPERNVVSWSSIMTGYLHCGFALEVLKLFKSMVFSGQPKPNEYVATVVFGSCSDSGRIQEGKQCHGYVIKSDLISHEYVRNALVYMYSSCSGIEEAIQLLDHLPHYDLLTFNSALSGFLENGALTEGVDILRKMVMEDVVWDNFTYTSVLRLSSNLRDLKLALQIHSRMLRVGFECDVVVSGAIVNMYGKCGKVVYAQRVFDHSDTQNIVLHTSIMDAYFQNRSFEEALNLFVKMETKAVPVPPNEFTFAVLLNSTAELSLLKHGDFLHGYVVKSGFGNYVMIGNALVNMYSKSGSIRDAKKVFLSMTYKDIISWNTMICGFSHHGLGREALEALDKMLIAGESPNHVTFIGILHACSHIGLVDEGLHYFNQLMKQCGVQPSLQHYTCIVGLLSKAGMFEEAENFMKTSPIEWDAVAWRTLLSACYVRRNYSVGKRVAESVIEMYPNDTGSYILLSNMYAKSKEWEGVAKVRSLMRKRQVKKEPGVSWIGIRSRNHVFLSKESQHPEIGLIYAKVGEILSKIRPLGYSPDVVEVCHDVDEEQREDCLSYHSEKLAVAYGLMKIPENSPLHVTKNLRICEDCHSAIKLISKVTNRIIIIRDANRFHEFKDGHCSCSDYW